MLYYLSSISLSSSASMGVWVVSICHNENDTHTENYQHLQTRMLGGKVPHSTAGETVDWYRHCGSE